MGKYKKGDNWYIDYYIHGRRKREKIGPSKALAEIVLKKRKVEIAEGKFLDKKKIEKIKFESFSRQFLDLHSKINKKSWQTDIYHVQALNSFFKGMYLHQITVEDIERFKAERSNQETTKSKAEKPQKVSPATVNRELATLKCIFNKAIAWGKIKENPARKVSFLKEPSGRLRFLELEEIKKLLANCPARLKPVVIVALNTGMRRSEIFGLKWTNLDFQRGLVHLYDTKNGDSREIPMNDLVRNALIEVRKHPGSPFVFCNKYGKPYHDARKSFYAAVKKSGIINFKFHDLRHTYASQLVMAGIDLNTTRELLGHRDIRMTLRYAHLSPNHKQRAVDILARRMDTFWTPKANLKNPENFINSQLIDKSNSYRKRGVAQLA